MEFVLLTLKKYLWSTFFTRLGRDFCISRFAMSRQNRWRLHSTLPLCLTSPALSSCSLTTELMSTSRTRYSFYPFSKCTCPRKRAQERNTLSCDRRKDSKAKKKENEIQARIKKGDHKRVIRCWAGLDVFLQFLIMLFPWRHSWK